MGPSVDADEQEADRVGRDVTGDDGSGDDLSGRAFPRVPARRSGPSTAPVGPAAPPVVADALASPGEPLDAGTRQFFEKRFGHDFGRVRVHTGGPSAASADAVGADAFSVGPDIVFAEGRYAPHSREGRRLLAHELAHVLHQGAVVSPGGAAVRRQPKNAPKSKGPTKTASPKPTAATAPKLEVTPSTNGPACACLVVVHNDEANARKTATLMHDNCAYNLALVKSATAGREVKIPGRRGTVDPNSLFPGSIAQRCIEDEKGCRAFLVDKAGSTDPDEIEELVQIQFFLAISECSKAFVLPVVALHNNDVEDTKQYLKEKDKLGVADLKLDVDKGKKDTGDDQIAKLKALLRKKFGDEVVTQTMETKGKTNIFRWCASTDLSRCHIGDPDHPDNVTWVTNEQDFLKLSKKDVNVVLQSEAPTSKGSESEGDLSTLFLLLKDIFEVRLKKAVETIERGEEKDWKELDALFAQMDALFKYKDQSLRNLFDLFSQIIDLLLDILRSKGLLLLMPAATAARIANLRYVNIETPGKRLADQSDAERVRNYEAIVAVLDATGLNCCGPDPKAAQDRVRQGLKTP